jgi:hypothetical protein
LASSYSLQIKAKDPDSDQYDLATVPITLTQWQVSRNGASKAPATSMIGCTIAELADEIGLQQNEFKKWLTFTTDTVTKIDGTIIPTSALSSSDLLAGGQQFQIPNTIYMAWFGEMGGLGKEYMNWSTNKNDLESLGFKVDTFDNDSFAGFSANSVKNVYKNMIETLSINKQLHGLYMMGHGNNNSVGSKGTNVYTLGPQWSIPYTGTNSIESLIFYKIGALIIHACYSNNDNAKSLKSDNGIFEGQTGTYVPIPPPVRIVRHWGFRVTLLDEIIFEYGGKQHTNIFDEHISFDE